MSLITDFPFPAFMADIKTRRTVSSKTGISLSLLTSEDMAEVAVVEVRAPCGAEQTAKPWAPVQRDLVIPGAPSSTGTITESLATFYDTRMGNFSVKGLPTQPCTTCTATQETTSVKLGNERCQGHFGFIGMPRLFPADPARHHERLYVINPHMHDEVTALLQAKCYFCHAFRAPVFDVDRWRFALLLADAGLMGEAKQLLEMVGTLRNQASRNRRGIRDTNRVISTIEIMHETVLQMLTRHHVISPDVWQTPHAVDSKEGEEKREDGESIYAEAIRAAEEAVAARRQLNSDYQSSFAALDLRQEICREALKELKDYNKTCAHCGAISPTIATYNGHLFFNFPSKSAQHNVRAGFLSVAQLENWKINNARHNRRYSYFETVSARNHIKQLFQKEYKLLALLFPRIGEVSINMPHPDPPLPPIMIYRVFFLDKVMVPPLPVRTSSGLRLTDSGAIAPDDSTRALSQLLKFVQEIEIFHLLYQSTASGPSEDQLRTNENNLRNLQSRVTDLYGEILNSFAKKEGLFRMNMMGKRVNQACRSVISPDYLVEPNEVLLPRPFARQLTYPEQVSTHSTARQALLMRCAINGPDAYPGATHLEWRMPSGEIRFIDLHMSVMQRRSNANRYFAMAQTGTLIVHRHILDGDRLIFNRQPTLHKVSMLGYRAKVLSGLKTLRFHYVNGKSYNADFDGDEMNVHVVQSLEAKAELDCVMNADQHYLVATSGKPIRGLIQDHLVAAVLLTLRDKFFDRDTFLHFVFTGLSPYLLRETTTSDVTLASLIPVPAVVWPQPRWTGKQLISALVKFITGVVKPGESPNSASSRGRSGAPTHSTGQRSGLHLRAVSLIQPSTYTHTHLDTLQQGRTASSSEVPPLATPSRSIMDDDTVVMQNSELLKGVLDKNQLGPSNLSIPHLIHELYGPHVVGNFFGALGRVLTVSLQREGFSMGMDDLMMVYEDRRSALLEALDLSPMQLPPEEQDNEAVVMPHIQQLATALQKEFIPGRLLVPFPKNQLIAMTASGAKGSNTNALQMSLGLGQQLFDGRRVGKMNSGKTLPPFFVGDKRARSFGYAMGRFSSGIRPAEYTIHAMAGREGLIDTAVKTSRSGYLQRCLIKGLESLVVQWDHSVRDSNGAVVQFVYGGDGLDPIKASTLQSWEAVKANAEDLAKRLGLSHLGLTASEEEGSGTGVPGEKHPRSSDSGVAETEQAVQKRGALHRYVTSQPLPPHLRSNLQSYLRKESTDYLLFKKVSQVERWMKKGSLKERLAKNRQDSIEFYEDVLQDMTMYKRAQAFCDAGEPVGLLAAQAAGEPSTQMTLNTFHSAGSTVTHVTEGIPRLRELLIHASVKNAAVIVPVVGATPLDEEVLTKAMRVGVAVRLAECLAREETILPDGTRQSLGVKGYQYVVSRASTTGKIARSTEVKYEIALLCSHAAIQDCRERCCMSESEHLVYFLRALRQFAKRIVASLSGGSGEGREEGGSGSGEAAVVGESDEASFGSGVSPTSPSQLQEDNEEDEMGAQEDAATPSFKRKKRHVEREQSDEEEEEGLGSSDSYAPSDAGNSEVDEDAEDDEDAVVGSRGLKRPRAARTPTSAPSPSSVDQRTAQAHTNLSDDDDEIGGRSNSVPISSNANARYDSFLPLEFSLRSSRFQLSIFPSSIPNSSGSKNAKKESADLFFVNIEIRTAEMQVCVLPDVIESVLSDIVMPTWLPQFNSVVFTRQVEDPRNGELVFQGPSANIDNVGTFLSILNVGNDQSGILLDEMRSTNIHHMVQSYGVESGYLCLLEELTKLFKRYAVDYHHLTLISDAATNRGKWENFNFTGIISHSTSPLFQMSFASSKRFLHTAVTKGVGDELRSLSASIIAGERPHVGTAYVKLIHEDPHTLVSDVIERTF